jgi:hypothetical protein
VGETQSLGAPSQHVGGTLGCSMTPPPDRAAARCLGGVVWNEVFSSPFCLNLSLEAWRSAEIGLASGLREIAGVLRFLETRGCHVSHAFLIGLQQTSPVACVVESVHLRDHQTEIDVGWSSNSKFFREDSGPRVFATSHMRNTPDMRGKVVCLFCRTKYLVIWFRVATIGTGRTGR